MKFSMARFAATCVAAVLAGSPGKPQTESTPNRDWTKDDFIAVRAHQNGSNEAPEFSFIIENTQDPRAIRAVLHQAQVMSLYQQLAALHAKDPSESYADLKGQLKVQTWSLTVAQCRAVKVQYDAFENIQFVRPRDEDE